MHKCGFVDVCEVPNVSRLTVDMTNEQHRRLKALAALEGKTIREYTLERLFPSEEQSWRDLQALLRDRIQEGLDGKLSAKKVGDVLDEELAEGGRS